MFNMGRLILHPVFDERIFFTIFPIRLNGGTSQFDSPTQSNVNASLPPSASGQIFFVIRCFSKANLFIVAMPHP